MRHAPTPCADVRARAAARRAVRCGAAALALAGSPAFGAGVAWITKGDGVYSDGANWQTGAPPGPTDDPLFTLPLAATVSFLANATNNALRVRDGDVTLAMGGRTLSLQNFTSSLVVGDTPGADVALRVRHGAVQTFAATAGGAGFGHAVLDIGEGAAWHTVFDARIADARDASATLHIHSGGAGVVQRDVLMGVQRGTAGVCVVEGVGSALHAGRNLNLGFAGDAAMVVRNGAHATAENLYVGRSGTSEGLFVVEGEGSGASFVFRIALGSGFRGTGGFVARDHASVSSVFGILGEIEESVATATVESGAEWRNLDFIIVVYKGAGTLRVGDGALVTSRTVNVGHLAGAWGEAVVVGPGARWENTEFVRVGVQGGAAGALRVEQGGALRSDTIEIGAWGEVSGDGEIESRVTNGGVIIPGARSEDGAPSGVGELTIAGDYTQQSAGRLVVTIAGPAHTSAHGVLRVDGDATLAGVFEARLADGFDPPLGSMFSVVRAGSIAGSFEEWVLPQLTGGRFFLAFSNGSTLTLAVLQGLQPPTPPAPPDSPVPLPWWFEPSETREKRPDGVIRRSADGEFSGGLGGS